MSLSVSVIAHLYTKIRGKQSCWVATAFISEEWSKLHQPTSKSRNIMLAKRVKDIWRSKTMNTVLLLSFLIIIILCLLLVPQCDCCLLTAVIKQQNAIRYLESLDSACSCQFLNLYEADVEDSFLSWCIELSSFWPATAPMTKKKKKKKKDESKGDQYQVTSKYVASNSLLSHWRNFLALLIIHQHSPPNNTVSIDSNRKSKQTQEGSALNYLGNLWKQQQHWPEVMNGLQQQELFYSVTFLCLRIKLVIALVSTKSPVLCCWCCYPAVVASSFLEQ